MRRPMTEDEFHRSFRSYRHTARRLEPRDRYNTATGTDDLVSQYLDGRLKDFSYMNRWTAEVRSGRAQGKLMQRVRIVTEPLSDYIRYTTSVARFNCAAGDDIHYLSRETARQLGIPEHEDVWIFDASWAMIINFNDDDQVVGYEREDGSADILQWLQHWDAAWHHAISRDDFAARHGVE